MASQCSWHDHLSVFCKKSTKSPRASSWRSVKYDETWRTAEWHVATLCWSENPPGRCPHPLRWTCASKPRLVDAFVDCAAVFFVIPSLADPMSRHPPNQRVSVRAATLWQRLRSISQVGRRIVFEYFRCYRKIGEHLFGVGNATCNAMLVGSTWKVCGFTSCSSVMEVPVSTARFQKHNLLSQVFVQ